MDSQHSSLSIIDKIIVSSQHYVELPCFAPPGWCNCCPDPSEMSLAAPKEMSAADLTLLNKENVTLTNSGEIQSEMLPAKKKKLSLVKSKNEQPPNDRFNTTIDDESLREATKAFCTKNTVSNNKWAVKSFAEWIEARRKKLGEPQKPYREIHSTSTISDIWDASIMQDLMKNDEFFSNTTSYNLAFSLSLYGMAIFKSTNISVWPVYLMLLNLPSSIRTNAENIMLCGLWVGP